YSPLNQSRKEIRLLTLIPGAYGTPLHGKLDTVCLDDDPEYEAISYVWGEPKSYEIVTISGRDFLLSKSLFYALQRLRKPDIGRTIWVDAICINQHDDETEKTTKLRS
ncbi:hypothetical protein AOQ84DRAFT_285643, partial [Glonium stellatum]